MLRAIIAGVAFVSLAASALAGKLDNPAAGAAPMETAAPATGADYFALVLPLTSAVMAEKFAAEHAEISAAIDVNGGNAEQQTALVDTLTRLAIGYELKLIEAPDDANSAVIDGQFAYISRLLADEGAGVCAPVIFVGSRDLIGRGLYEKYAPLIDATMTAYFDAVKRALDSPLDIGAMTDADGAVAVAQMAAQGDKALMDHFGVMQRDSPENCPAVLALIEAARAIEGISGMRMRAAQARGASRL